MKYLIGLFRFVRPHTILGTTISLLVLYALAWQFYSDEYPDPAIWLWALAACLAANIYIVGLNQLMDVEIDRINKPWLPLANGIFSKTTGWSISVSMLIVSLMIAIWQGWFLTLTVILSVVLGTLYSAPPVRLKRYHFWAAFCILVVRGIIVNLGLYLHFQYRLAGDTTVPMAIWLLTAFIFCFSLCIAWFKDMPDMKGDERFNIHTLSLQQGSKKVFKWGMIWLIFTYLAMIGMGWRGISMLNDRIFLWGHIGAFLLLIITAIIVRMQFSKSRIRGFYLFIWFLFYLEYGIFIASAGWWMRSDFYFWK